MTHRGAATCAGRNVFFSPPPETPETRRVRAAQHGHALRFEKDLEEFAVGSAHGGGVDADTLRERPPERRVARARRRRRQRFSVPIVAHERVSFPGGARRLRGRGERARRVASAFARGAEDQRWLGIVRSPGAHDVREFFVERPLEGERRRSVREGEPDHLYGNRRGPVLVPEGADGARARAQPGAELARVRDGRGDDREACRVFGPRRFRSRGDASVGDARCPSRAGTRRALRERGARQRYGGFDVRARVAVVQEHALHALHHFTRSIGGVGARTRALHERQKRLGRRHEHVRARRVDRYGAKKRVRERRARDAQRLEPRGPAFGPGARERRRGRDVERHAPALAGHHRAPARARGRGHARGLQERARQRELKHDRLAAALGRACGERGGDASEGGLGAGARRVRAGWAGTHS